MRRQRAVLGMLIAAFLVAGLTVQAAAQQPQIPTIQVCNHSLVKGTGVVKIDSRVDAQSPGTIRIRVEVKCDPAAGYPSLGVLALDFELSDSQKGTMTATTLEQLTSTGKHTPTAYMSGRCTMTGVTGCHFWLMPADNHPSTAGAAATRDVVSVLVLNGSGQRVAYGTGPLVQGDIEIAASPN